MYPSELELSLLAVLFSVILIFLHWFQRLLVNTPGDHPDYVLLQEAETTLHNFAKKIGHLSEPQVEDGQQETLKKLELLLITDVSFVFVTFSKRMNDKYSITCVQRTPKGSNKSGLLQ